MLLDTGAIIEIFRNPAGSPSFEEIRKAIGDEEVYVSVVQLAEISDWAIKNNAPPRERVKVVKEIGRIVPIDEEICQDAAVITNRHRNTGRKKFGIIDGIILASARSIGQRVLTLDEDFSGEKDCVII